MQLEHATAKLLLIDAHHNIYRAFHAIPPMFDARGRPINAVFGFVRMLRKLLGAFEPTHALAIFDGGVSAYRRELLPAYKSGRPMRPKEMDEQVPIIQDILEAMGIQQVTVSGEEADDVVATFSTFAAARNAKVYIASNDKDFAQLVRAGFYWIRSEKGEFVVMDEAAVKARYGVLPESMVDFMCLTGDKVDDIPGVPGVGATTAAKLLNQFGSVDKLLCATTAIDRPKLRASIETSHELIRTNRLLVKLRTDVSVPYDYDESLIKTTDARRLNEVFQQYGLRTLLIDVDCNRAESQGLLQFG